MSVAGLLLTCVLLLCHCCQPVMAAADGMTGLIDAESAGKWQAGYRVFFGKREIGSAQRRYRLSSSGYELSSRMQPAAWARIFGQGVVEQSSSGRWSENGEPQPEHYSYLLRKADEQPREYKFDYSRELLTFSGGSLPLSPSVQDELSQQLLFARNLGGAETAWDVPVLSGSKQRIYHHQFRVLGEREVAWELQNGEILRHVYEVELTSSRNKYRTLFWLAGEIGYLPLKIERQHLRKNERLTLKLESLVSSQ